MSNEQSKVIPEDFPRQGILGSVSGAQAKLLARKINGRFVAGPTHEELYAHYDNCADLVEQLTAYVRRKLVMMPGTSIDELLPRVRRGVANKGWDVSSEEMDWIFRKVADQLKRAQ
jgi:hypothetical protein